MVNDSSHVTVLLQPQKGREVLTNPFYRFERTSQSEASKLSRPERSRKVWLIFKMASTFGDLEEIYAPSAADLLAFSFLLLWIVLALFQLISIATA